MAPVPNTPGLGIELNEDAVKRDLDDPEAEYSRVQIQNIVNAVVPKQELLDAQMELALNHFEHSA